MEKYDDESSKKWKEVFEKLFNEFSESENGYVFDTADFSKSLKKLVNQQKIMNENLKDLNPNQLMPGLFIQKLDDVNSKENFERIVKDNNLSLNVDIIKKNGRKFVIEKWGNGNMEVKKVYPLTEEVFDYIDNETQLTILEKQLEQSLILEDYEECAILRDKINDLKN